MIKRVIAASLVAFAVSGYAAPGTAPLTGFKADYEVLRNGKPLGKATLDLHNAGNDWEFISETQGTSGMAAMLGAQVHEKSTFTWNANKPQCLTYAYSQKALKTKSTSIACDWSAKTANVDDNGKSATVSLTSAAMDRHLVPLALMVDLEVRRAIADVSGHRQIARRRSTVPAGGPRKRDARVGQHHRCDQGHARSRHGRETHHDLLVCAAEKLDAGADRTGREERRNDHDATGVR